MINCSSRMVVSEAVGRLCRLPWRALSLSYNIHALWCRHAAVVGPLSSGGGCVCLYLPWSPWSALTYLRQWCPPNGRIQESVFILPSNWAEPDALEPSVIVISDTENEPVGISCWRCERIHPACSDKLLTKCSTRVLMKHSVRRLMALRSFIWQKDLSSANSKMSTLFVRLLTSIFMLDSFPSGLTTKWTTSSLRCRG